jgi:hypothetical protein
MTETKSYEVGLLQFAFTPQGDPFEGRLRAIAPELAPYTAEVKLASSLSRNRYAKGAAEDCGMDQKELKRALNVLCSLREEEVEVAAEAESGLAAEEPEEVPEVGQEEIDALVGRSGVLRRFVTNAAEIHGVVGEKAALKLLALNALGAQLAPLPNGKPVGANVVLIAGWGRGKNHLADAVATLLPEDFFLAFESASAMALYYMAEEDPRVLAFHWVYLNEAEAMDQLVEMLRPLISSGKATRLTVNRDSGGRNTAQTLDVEGPVTTTIPTIRNKLDAQLQSRMLTAELEDYEGRVASHSRKVSELLLPDFATEDFSPRIRAWQAALASLTGIRRVVFPLTHEQFRFDRDDVSHGARLWANILGLMCAHAWLEQRNREIVELPNGEKAIVATPRDYSVAYGVFQATCERSVVNLSDSHRRILDAVYQLQLEDRSTNYLGFDDNDNTWSQREIARRTGVPQSTISGQKSYLVKSLRLLVEGYDGKLRLADDADPSWWRKEGALDGLPKPKQVRAWWKGEDDPPDPGTPDRPDHPPEDPADRPVGGANGDRGASGHRPEAPGQPAEKPEHRGDRGGDLGDPRGPGQENALDKQENGHEGTPTGVTGGFESKDGVSREDSEPENHIRDTDDREGGSRTVSKASTYAEWKTRSAKENLDMLGWARARTFMPAESTESVDSAGDYLVAEEDPVASTLGSLLWFNDRWAETAARMLRLKPKGKSEEELRSMGWPVNSQQMHKRLEELAPFLQGKNPDCRHHPVRLDRFIHAEYWVKESADEGLWVFIAAREGGPTEEEVEEIVWGEVKYLEGIAPPNPFRRD